jgi:putative drug exporter of the RND superfamily
MSIATILPLRTVRPMTEKGFPLRVATAPTAPLTSAGRTTKSSREKPRFGLSMDYEVFILSRMREEYDRTGDTSTAVVGGIGRTGRLVTSAALILFLSFVSLASGPGTDLKMFATGLAAGILLDATVIRALLVPAVVSLFGRWNWILPHRPARLLRVEPSIPARVAAPEEAG